VNVGTSNLVTVTFTTDDGNPATALNVTAGLSPLPAGWSGPGTFTCATFSTGTGCLLELTYAPTAATMPTNQVLTLNYSYLNDAGLGGTGTVTIDFSATVPPPPPPPGP
jgi:hypothetical protein